MFWASWWRVGFCPDLVIVMVVAPWKVAGCSWTFFRFGNDLRGVWLSFRGRNMVCVASGGGVHSGADRPVEQTGMVSRSCWKWVGTCCGVPRTSGHWEQQNLQVWLSRLLVDDCLGNHGWAKSIVFYTLAFGPWSVSEKCVITGTMHGPHESLSVSNQYKQFSLQVDHYLVLSLTRWIDDEFSGPSLMPSEDEARDAVNLVLDKAEEVTNHWTGRWFLWVQSIQ